MADDDPFISEIAKIYSKLGASVLEQRSQQDGLAWLYVEQCTPDGLRIRTAVYCYRGPQPIDAREFSEHLRSLRSNGAVDMGVVVSAVGLSEAERALLAQEGIGATTLRELEQRVADFRPYLRHLIARYEKLEVAQRGTFIPLAARTEDGESVLSVVEYIDDWLSKPGGMLTILGEYGSGKTTTSWHMAQRIASDYLRNEATDRVPVLVELKQFRHAFSMQTLFAALTTDHGVRVPSYASFVELNEEGKLLLFLDGFDEMSTHADPATVFANFDAILDLVSGKAKVILTCRSSFFRDRADFERLQSGMDLRSLLQRKRSAQVLLLQGYTDEQMKEYLAGYYGEKWTVFFDELRNRPDFRSLAERPILLNMVVHTIANPEALRSLDLTEVYTKYTDIWLKRDDWRCHLPPGERSRISKLLAFELVRSQASAIHHKQLRSRLGAVFGSTVNDETLDQYAHEVQVCTFLSSDMRGCYSFAHRSIAEFLAASYAYDEVTQGRTAVLGSDLSPVTLHFLSSLVNKGDHRAVCISSLFSVLRTDGVQSLADGTVRSTAAYLLLRCGSDLADLDLSGIHLPEGCDLTGVNLSSVRLAQAHVTRGDFSRAFLEEADLSYAVLTDCNFTNASLNKANLCSARITRCDFTGCVLRGANFFQSVFSEVTITPKGITERKLQSATEHLLQKHRSLSGLLTSTRRLRGERRLIDQVAGWTQERGIAKLQEASATLATSIATGSLSSKSRKVEVIADIEKEIAECNRQLQLQQRGQFQADPGVQQRRARAEAKKRLARRQFRSEMLKLEYLVKQCRDLEHEARLVSTLADDLRRREGSLQPQVVGARFLDSHGLSADQSAWLKEKGAQVKSRVEITEDLLDRASLIAGRVEVRFDGDSDFSETLPNFTGIVFAIDITVEDSWPAVSSLAHAMSNTDERGLLKLLIVCGGPGDRAMYRRRMTPYLSGAAFPPTALPHVYWVFRGSIVSQLPLPAADLQDMHELAPHTDQLVTALTSSLGSGPGGEAPEQRLP